MKKVSAVFLACMLMMALGTFANAVLIDFETASLGSYTSLTISDVTFTSPPGLFSVVSANPGWPISGNSLSSYWGGQYPIIATFSTQVLSVKVGVGDYGQDDDELYMEAYDSGNNLLAQAYYYNPAGYFGGDYLYVSSSTPISYVKLYETGSWPMAVYWDNFEYAPVPIPGALLLLGSGLIGLGGLKRKFRNR